MRRAVWRSSLYVNSEDISEVHSVNGTASSFFTMSAVFCIGAALMGGGAVGVVCSCVSVGLLYVDFFVLAL